MSRTPAPTPPMEDLHAWLRAWARGVYPTEAGPGAEPEIGRAHV